MSHETTSPHHRRRRPWAAPLRPRSREEEHRAATPLELFFDLVIVVAVAQAASGLHHAISEGHAGTGVLTYTMVFFGVWWAWVNFTWFASAYDNDDIAYRLLVLLQLTGALVFAAGIPAFQHGDFRVGVLGYVIMRLALVTLWLRATAGDPERRVAARRYAAGVALLQAAWVGFLFVPPGHSLVVFWTLVVGELLVPAWAERAAPTPWHPGHIAERYGLFTIIALGESILAATVAVRQATEAGAGALSLLPTVAGGLLVVFSFWWLYFEHPGHEVLTSVKAAFVWGYLHYFVFAAVAAVGAGLAVSLDHLTDRAHVSPLVAGSAVSVPAAVYLITLWLLLARSEPRASARLAGPVAAVAVLLTPLTAQPVLWTGILMATLVAFKCLPATGPSSR